MMAKGEGDAHVFYRRASALRRLGRFDQALADIDRAIGMLDAGENLVHLDFVRERELIVSSRETRDYVTGFGEQIQERLAAEARQQIEVASAALEKRIAQAQQVVSDGLLKLVEILGLFVALIGFVAGTGAAAFTRGSTADRAISMGLVLVGSLMFFVLLRMVTSFRRRG